MRWSNDDAPCKVEYAKSGRAGCRMCSSLIEMSSVRVGVEEEGPVYGTYYKWFHLACFDFKAANITRPSQISGIKKLSRDDKQAVKLKVKGRPTTAAGAGTRGIRLPWTCTGVWRQVTL
eukprot:3883615-Pyramimonas_sp.AAC.1